MTKDVFCEWLKEPRANLRDIQDRQKVLFLDNYNGHEVTEQASTALERLKTRLQYFPANATHLIQPCDSFVISKIKDAWRRRWEEKKLDMIKNGEWQDEEEVPENPQGRGAGRGWGRSRRKGPGKG